MQINSCHIWQKGINHVINQDSLCITQFVIKKKRITMAIVCDGIGSLPHSEDASSFLCEWMTNWIYRDGLKSFHRLKNLGFTNAVKRELFRCYQAFLKRYNVPNGCAYVICIIVNKKAYTFNSGDCRAYTTNHKKIKQISKDDFIKGTLTACFTNQNWYTPNVFCFHLSGRKKLLLCSDGFYRKLSNDDLSTLLSYSKPRMEMPLLNECLERVRVKKEKDDISAILISTY